jgi:membrane protease YdiL (CAAX protease family)
MFDANNRLFVLAQESEPQPSMLVAITVTFVTLAITIVAGQMLARIIFHAIPLAGTQSSIDPLVEGLRRLIDDAVGFLPAYLCLWGWLAFWSKRSFRTLGFDRQRPFAHALGGGLVGLLMMSIVAIGIAMLPRSGLGRGTLQTAGLAAIGGSLLTLAGTSIQSSAEEVLFRGWLLPSIGVRAGPWKGVIVSSLLFGVAHGLNPHVTALGVINLTLFGGFLALYALREGGLWGACAWHSSWNWTESDLFGLSGSGGPLHAALLTSVKPGGPDIVTGGAFGPDGGLIQLAVLLIGIAVLVSWRRMSS